MVRLTEVEDEHFSEKPAATKDDALLADDDADYEDTDSEISSISSGDAEGVYTSSGTEPDETLAERIAALKDIIPPNTRAQIYSASSSIYNATGSVISYGGKGLWVLATSAFLLGIPYALALLQEQEIVEEEKRVGMMQEGAGAMLQGGESGTGEVKSAL